MKSVFDPIAKMRFFLHRIVAAADSLPVADMHSRGAGHARISTFFLLSFQKV